MRLHIQLEDELVAELDRRCGHRHQADCLIAAAAVGIGATVVTGNPRDFPMDELEVAHWPAGE